MDKLLREIKRDTPLLGKGVSLKKFLDFLKEENRSPATCKNYAADIKHFLKFFETKKATEFSPKVFSEYRSFLITIPLSLKTLNRKLSALRKFGDYLTFSGTSSHNPALNIKNVTPLAKKVVEIKTKRANFLQSLLSPQLKQPVFLSALIIFSVTFSLVTLSIIPKSPPPSISSPTPKPVLKTLTFQGQLASSKLTLATFKLWDQKINGSQLYTSGYCFVRPDQNGLFSIVIGQDCGRKIPASLLTKYEKIYLEMEASNTDIKPVRTQILDTNLTLFASQQSFSTPSPKPEKGTDGQILEEILTRLTSTSTSTSTTSPPTSTFLTTPATPAEKDFKVSGKIIDGGLGIFGTSGKELPSTFDFTKGLILEFDFQTGTQDFEALLSPETEKSYYFSWTKNNDFSIGKIMTGLKDEFLKVEKIWQDNTWFHGKIALQQSILSFKVSGTSISAPLDIQGVPLTKTGTISFNGLESIANLRIFSGETETLASTDAEIDGRLSVNNGIQVNLSGTTSTNEVCWQGSMDGAALVTCSSGADLAEYYQAAEDVEEGDIVSIQGSTFKVQGSEKSSFLVSKSSRSYDPNLIGVISTLPWRIMGEQTEMGNAKPVALAGRVPVKVKGEIQVGDPLTSSDIPGIAKKATQEGLILGRALESCHPKDTCKILAFINISWHKPESAFLAENAEEFRHSEFSSESEMLNQVQHDSDNKRISERETSILSNWNWEKDLTLSNDLTVLGKTSLGETSIADQLMVDGSLILGKTGITNLFGPLKLQPLGQERVDILNGKMIIDNQGNLTVQGKVLAQEIETKKLTIKENAGTAILPAGQSQLLITNYSITPNSLIFLTPLSSTANQSLYVKLKNPGEHFIVATDKALPHDISFNWLIVN